uniref:Elicitin n=1 Tax=Hyaloperonospora arabidopsidis (strain Emoy2) TaxID=559515 RepID=M4BNH1_HYAAE
MTGRKFVPTIVTTLLVTSVVSAQECPPDVSESFVATVDNSSYFSTCAEGTTFNVTSVFDVFNFTANDLLQFCNSSSCLEPIHELMGSLDCNISYMGTPRNLSSEVSDLHDVCHEVLDAAEGSGQAAKKPMDLSDHADGSSHSDPTTSDASSSVVLSAVFSVASAAIVAVFLA